MERSTRLIFSIGPGTATAPIFESCCGRCTARGYLSALRMSNMRRYCRLAAQRQPRWFATEPSDSRTHIVGITTASAEKHPPHRGGRCRAEIAESCGASKQAQAECGGRGAHRSLSSVASGKV